PAGGSVAGARRRPGGADARAPPPPRVGAPRPRQGPPRARRAARLPPGPGPRPAPPQARRAGGHAPRAQVQLRLPGPRGARIGRRDREIGRTRARINRTLPRAALEAESPTETWQDVLRRFAEEQSASTGTGG